MNKPLLIFSTVLSFILLTVLPSRRKHRMSKDMAPGGDAGGLPYVRRDKRWLVSELAKNEVTAIGPVDWLQYANKVARGPISPNIAWCGLFALWVLREAGLAQNWEWTWGKGFAYRLPRARLPEIGDIAYIDKPYQHHAIVVGFDGINVTTVDGNQENDTIKEVVRPLGAFSAFYSIGPLL